MTSASGPRFDVLEDKLSYVPAATKPWNLDVFINEFQVPVTLLTPEEIKFELINADCSFANAVRRIICDEVPSVTIERVYMRQNTSVVPDEMLSHRFGLLPLNVDPDQLAFCSSELPETDDLDIFDSNCHLIFDVKVVGESPKPGSSGDGENTPISVYSSCLKWVPLPGQEEMFSDSLKPAPVYDNVLLAKLNPGDEITARCLAVKGVGMDHAKFMPSSVAYYKCFPSIELKGTIRGDLALKLQKNFAEGVIKVDPQTQIASVADSRLDNGSREYLMHKDLSDVVKVSLNPRHLLFTVETNTPGVRSPESIVVAAFDIMLSKCAYYLAIVEKPDFATTPLSNPDLDLDPTDRDNGNANSKLNGRAAGVCIRFVSPDLRRAVFCFKGEDHTLGCALRYCILRSESVRLCGYCQPHPLENEINFEIQSKKETAAMVLRNGLYCLRACFEHIKRKFKSSVRKAQKQSMAVD
ncbi:hypothetical protein Aperf_G00000037273 [Anoplocephala perfoliata]